MKTKTYARWCEREFELARFLRKQGLSFEVIADALAIAGFEARMGDDISNKLRREGRRNLVADAAVSEAA
jgi:hypothetical protein